MKKTLLALSILLGFGFSASAQQKAIYVKQGDKVTKFNFGVAGDLNFSNNGNTLTVTGYKEAIDLTKVDFISFSPLIDNTALTPSAQKEKLLAIGDEINKCVDMKGNADMIRLFAGFLRSHENSGPVSNYYIDPQYWDVHNAFNDVVESAQALTKGSIVSVSALRTAAVDLYKLSDYYGVFEADTVACEWKKVSNAQYLEIRYPGFAKETFSVRLEGSGTAQKWDNPNANIELPGKLTLTFSQNGKAIGSTEITSTLKQDENITLQTVFASGTYAVNDVMTILNNGITDNLEVKFNNKVFCTVKSNVEGRNLLVYEEMKDAVNAAKHSHDEHGECMDDGDLTPLFSHIFRGTTDVDVLGKLQSTGRIFNLDKLNGSLSQDSDVADCDSTDGKITYYNGKFVDWNPNTGTLRVTYDIPEIVEDKAKYLNNYSDAPFFYDGTKEMQGYLAWQKYVSEEEFEGPSSDPNDEFKNGFVILNGYVVHVSKQLERDYVDGHEVTYWTPWTYSRWTESNGEFTREDVAVDEKDVIQPGVMVYEYQELSPVIVFPDLTSLRVEDYFTKEAFKALVDDYENIIDSYYSITGQERPADDFGY